jgi:hypothetical protein
MTTVNVDSLPIERPLVVGANSEGYSRKKILIPNVDTQGADSVSSVTMTNNGSSYETPPTVAFTGGGGSGAAGTAVLGFGIASAAVTAPGSYATEPTIGATVGTGATFNLHMRTASGTVAAGGSGYVVDDQIVFTGGVGTQAAIVVTGVSGGAITSFAVTGDDTLPGDYTTLPANPVAQGSTSGSGTGATFNMLWGLLSIEVTAPGQNYDDTSALTVTGGGGTGGGTGTLTLEGSGTVKAVTITDGGEDYLTAPTVSFTGGGGSGAAGTAVIGGADDPITVSLAFSPSLPTADYAVKAIANQPCVASYDNKTADGVDVILTPLDGESMVAGTMDAAISFTS